MERIERDAAGGGLADSKEPPLAEVVQTGRKSPTATREQLEVIQRVQRARDEFERLGVASNASKYNKNVFDFSSFFLILFSTLYIISLQVVHYILVHGTCRILVSVVWDAFCTQRRDQSRLSATRSSPASGQEPCARRCRRLQINCGSAQFTCRTLVRATHTRTLLYCINFYQAIPHFSHYDWNIPRKTVFLY